MRDASRPDAHDEFSVGRVENVEAEGPGLACSAPRVARVEELDRVGTFDESRAGELGVDKVFGKGTTPGEVASYLVHELAPDKERVA